MTDVSASELSDVEVRHEAVVSDDSFLIRAPAGSGKTELLIQRYLRLLARVQQPEAILALTFTRKAAGEMRERILAALRPQSRPADSHQQRTWELAAAVRRRDTELGWHLLQSPARVRVTTFDGLALSLLGRTPWLARADVPLHPAENADKLYQQASRATLAHVEEDGPAAGTIRRLLAHFGADVDAAVGLLAEMLSKRDQWTRWVKRVQPDPGALRASIEAGLRAEVARELRGIRQKLRGCGLPLPGDDLTAWQALAEAVLCKGKPQARRQGPGANLSHEDCKVLHRVRSLPADLSGEEWEALRSAVELLPAAEEELARTFAAAGECDFTAITLAAVEALGDEVLPSLLADALDARLQHLFVDEFQDTSRAHQMLLERLVGEWSDGDGRTLFVVGDAMQSIYGFRDADVKGFLNAGASGRLGQVRLRVLSLRRNFRSYAPVVAWVNQHFEAAAQLSGAMDSFTSAQHVRTSGSGSAAPRVEVHAIQDPSGNAEAARVRELVQMELDAPENPEIAILVRGRSHAKAIAEELRRADIAYEGAGSYRPGESTVMGDLWALTRAILDPADRVAWLVVLRAPWCGLRLADLHSLCAGEPYATIPELVAERAGKLSPDGRARAAAVMMAVEAAASHAGRVALASLVAWCWDRLGGANIPGAGGAVPDPAEAAIFFAALEDLTAGNPRPDRAELETALDQLRAPAASDTAGQVRILTMHEAKGLEFDTVILPCLDRKPQNSPSPLLRWLAGDDYLLVAPRPAAGASKKDTSATLFGYLKERQREEDQREQLRLLYVAATRAQRALHLVARTPKDSAHGQKPEPRSLLARLWSTLAPSFPAAPAAPPPTAAATGADLRYPQLRRRAQGLEIAPADASSAGHAIAGAAFTPWSADTLERRTGTVVHALLQRLADGDGRSAPPRAEIERTLRLAGVAPRNVPEAVSKIERALTLTLADERGRWILDRHPESRCEWAIGGVREGRVEHRILDRSFVEDGVRWVVDYKTAVPARGESREIFFRRQEELYREPLSAYVRLLREHAPRPVRCGLYFPLLPAWHEVRLD